MWPQGGVHTDGILSVSGGLMNHFINENWREIVRETGKPITESVGNVFFTVSKTVPYKDAFDDT
jgi:hypothetical protein